MSDSGSEDDHIQVVLRVRPLIPAEIERGESGAVWVVPAAEESQYALTSSSDIKGGGGDDYLVRVLSKPKTTATGMHGKRSAATEKLAKHFSFDVCIGTSASQDDVFHMAGVQHLCDEAFAGKATTIMCFGQTGSGKTYTMSGFTLPTAEDEGQDEQAPPDATPVLVNEDGIQYRAIQVIADTLERSRHTVADISGPTDDKGKKKKKKDSKNTTAAAAQDSSSKRTTTTTTTTKITVKASYLELYNERIRDLLSGAEDLKCRWSAAAQSFFVQDLLIVECLNQEDLLMVLREGQANRHRASHLLNQDSSRSHALFTVYIDVDKGDGTPTTHGKMTFVDLAGSERLRDTGSSGEDTKSINKSLFALGNVIEKLSARCNAGASGGGDAEAEARSMPPVTANERAFIPYRSSVLTQLLMDSLDGSARTVMVACVTPSARFTEESLRTLHYAQRARSIAARPAERVDMQERERHEMRLLARRLKAENALFRSYLGLPPDGALSEDDIAFAVTGAAPATRRAPPPPALRLPPAPAPQQKQQRQQQQQQRSGAARMQPQPKPKLAQQTPANRTGTADSNVPARAAASASAAAAPHNSRKNSTDPSSSSSAPPTAGARHDNANHDGSSSANKTRLSRVLSGGAAPTTAAAAGHCKPAQQRHSLPPLTQAPRSSSSSAAPHEPQSAPLSARHDGMASAYQAYHTDGKRDAGGGDDYYGGQAEEEEEEGEQTGGGQPFHQRQQPGAQREPVGHTTATTAASQHVHPSSDDTTKGGGGAGAAARAELRQLRQQQQEEKQLRLQEQAAAPPATRSGFSVADFLNQLPDTADM